MIMSHEDKDAPEKPAQVQMYAEAFTAAARATKGWPLSKQRLVAAQVAIVENETHGSLRIHRNECNLLKRECDAGKAISSFQLHANALSDPKLWPLLGFMTLESTTLAAREASRAFVRSYRYCDALAPKDQDRMAMAFTAYAGRGCKLDMWKGWKARMATYVRVMRVPVPKAQPAAEG